MAGGGAMITGLIIGVLFFLISAIFLQALVKIKAVHRAVVMNRGKRQERVIKKTINGIEVEDKETVTKDEGWRLFWLRPYWRDYIEVDVGRKTLEFKQEVITPDKASSMVPIILVFRPLGKYLNQYIESGREEGVKRLLMGKTKGRLREWAMSLEEGPSDWKELNRSQLAAIETLIKVIASGQLISKIPEFAQQVPTFIWLRYFSKPRPFDLDQLTKNEKSWAEAEDGSKKCTWEKVEKIYVGLEDKSKPDVELSELQEELRNAVEERRKEINGIRGGSAKIEIPNLGITIEGLNFEDIKLIGETAKKADAKAMEQEEREAEELELEFIKERIVELMKPPLNYTRDQALEIVQTERSKVIKTINENKLNISPETRTMIEKIASDILAKTSGGK